MKRNPDSEVIEMTLGYALALGLHQFATIVWVGGMFFAHMALRPALADVIRGPERAVLMLAVFQRFFPWVWVSIVLLWASGGWYFAFVLQRQAAMHVHLMMGVALLMTLIFIYIFVVPYRQMKIAVDQENWAWAGAKVALIRGLVLVNLGLGLITALAGSAGKFLLPG